MQKRAKKEVFGHFLEFGTSDRLDIAYEGSPIYYMGNLNKLISLNKAKKYEQLD